MTIAKRMALGFGAVLLVVGLITTIVLVDLRHIQERTDVVINHDAAIINNARILEKLIVDMETGQRGFLITGDDEFLEPYIQAVNQFDSVLEQQKNLVKDTPHLLALLEKIERELQHWERAAASPEIAMRRKIAAGRFDTDHLQKTLAKGVGKGILDQMRAVAAGIEHAFDIDGNMTGVLLTGRILKSMVDQETGQRGFLITGKEEFLEPFAQGKLDLKHNFKRLRALVEKAHDRQATDYDITEIERLHNKWLSNAAEPEITLKRKVVNGDASDAELKKLLEKSIEKDIFDQIELIAERLAKRFLIAENESLVIALDGLIKAAVDQETGQRGFLITGKEDFLKPYHRGGKNWKVQIARLRRLNANAYNITTMNRNITRLENLAAQWLEKAALPEIAIRRAINKNPDTFKDVVRMLRNGVGKNILDNLRTLFEQFIRESSQLAEQRYTDAVNRSENATATTIVLAALALILGSFIAVRITLRIIRPINQLNHAFAALIDGDHDQSVDLKTNDEFESLARSFNEMVTELGRLDREHDVANHQLKQTNADLEAEARSKAAQNELTYLLRDVEDLGSLGETALSFLTKFSNSQAGALYLSPDKSEPNADLALCSTYALTRRKQLMLQFKPGEGLIGQVARDQKPLVVCDIPDDADHGSNSALGVSPPSNLLVLPLIYRDELKGVIELGAFSTYPQSILTDIQPFLNEIARTIDEIQDLQRINKLLSETQMQADQLTAANDALTEKTNYLDRQKDELEQKNIAIEKARQDIQNQADEIARASQYKSDFLANMSHEIRTPMTAILGYSSELRENICDPQNIDAVNTIQANGEHLLRIINDILDLSKVESGKLDFETIDVHLPKLLDEVRSLFDVRARSANLDLSVVYENPIPLTIRSDPTRIRQILVNLVGNAIKFTREGSVTISAKTVDPDVPEPEVQIDVIDTGIGMSDDQVERIFEPFVQADTSTTRQFGGTGLGLTISHRFAKLLGGNLSVESKKGEGSCFSVTFATGPLTDARMIDDPDTFDTHDNQDDAEKQSDLPQIPSRILVAEDVLVNQKLISRLLTKAGAEVTVADNGRIAVDLALEAESNSEPFDIILMDMQMPVLDGYAASTELRNAGYTKPIIALTAHAMAEDKQKCLDAGCDDFATKPFDKVKLLNTIKSLLDQQSPALQSVD